jgi:tRNA modification GTPase
VAAVGVAAPFDMTDLEDTIVAVSSAPGAGARAIVRLSGTNLLPVLEPVFSSSEPLERRRRRWEGILRIPEVHSPLPADLYYWVGPHSYTGQDVAELHTLSSPPLIELLVARLLHLGARAARPGEMTMRGFLAGKLDLTRAEAVHGVIEAGNRGELKHALTQLAGGVTRPLQELREDLLNLRADVEAGLDFSEEDLTFVETDDLIRRIGKGIALVTLAGKQVDQRGMTERPYRAVLAGRPNAGKSSLFNALGGGKALVSPEAGTTRDYLVQRIEFNGITLELVDTAGRHRASETMEEQAQQLGREQTQEADLVLLCVPATEGLSVEEAETRQADNVLLIATKADMATSPPDRLATSAVTGLGLAQLQKELDQRARAWARPALAPSLSRCRHHIAACLDHLRRAHSIVLFGEEPEVLAMELAAALDELGEMVGAVYSNDLLDRIFSRFCIGK